MNLTVATEIRPPTRLVALMECHSGLPWTLFE